MSTSAVLCAECLHSLRTKTASPRSLVISRQQSSSAFGQRVSSEQQRSDRASFRPSFRSGGSSNSGGNTSSNTSRGPLPSSSSGSRFGRPYEHRGQSQRTERAGGYAARDRPDDGRNQAPSYPRRARPDTMLRDWRSAAPSTSSSPGPPRFQRQSQPRDSPRQPQFASRNPPRPEYSQNRQDNIQRSPQPDTRELEYLDARLQKATSGGKQVQSPPSSFGHRSNLKTHATKPEYGYKDEKDRPKNVNFGQGSALAAFMAKQAEEKAKEAAKAGRSAAAAGSRTARASKPPLRQARRPSAPKKTVEIPATASVNALSQILGLKLRRLQLLMGRMGIEDARPDKLLSAEDASLIADELGYKATVVDEDAGFDIYASAPPEDASLLPLRPPIVTIMGHVDHGKTSLLDALRRTKVAAGEAGGITQHIGAFDVPLSSLLSNAEGSAEEDFQPSTTSAGSITFLDTPGHAAFTAMRSRGASVTDVAVLVVAADDSVKPQTREVIDLIKNEDVGLVVAITKCDKPGIDTSKVHSDLFSCGLEVEAIGGDVPCVEVSAKTGEGLADLVETINVVAEVRDLRAEVDGIPSEGRVIESRVDKGKGNVTTVIVTRGTLRVGTLIIAGKAFARIRQLTSGSGAALEEAGPGTPVEVTGWKNLPEAGDVVLEAPSEEQAKDAIETRERREERAKELGDMDAINEKRRIIAEANVIKRRMQNDARKAGLDPNKINLGSVGHAYAKEDDGVKELNLIVKADFTGTEEAVSNALAEIGNSEARVKIVETGVGDVTDGDLALAKAIEGVIVAFNVTASRQILNTAQTLHIPILQNNVIYRLTDDIKARVIDLLPKLYDQRVLGEATIQQVFKYTVKGAGQNTVAGCRVTNGVLTRNAKVKITRDKEVIFEGNMKSLKHHKDEVEESRKGSECGILLEGFEAFQEGDILQCYEDIERKRNL